MKKIITLILWCAIVQSTSAQRSWNVEFFTGPSYVFNLPVYDYYFPSMMSSVGIRKVIPTKTRLKVSCGLSFGEMNYNINGVIQSKEIVPSDDTIKYPNYHQYRFEIPILLEYKVSKTEDFILLYAGLRTAWNYENTFNYVKDYHEKHMKSSELNSFNYGIDIGIREKLSDKKRYEIILGYTYYVLPVFKDAIPAIYSNVLKAGFSF